MAQSLPRGVRGSSLKSESRTQNTHWKDRNRKWKVELLTYKTWRLTRLLIVTITHGETDEMGGLHYSARSMCFGSRGPSEEVSRRSPRIRHRRLLT